MTTPRGYRCASALESHAAFETGAAEEQLRIARDIYDNIGIPLMGALQSQEPQRKDQLIRETLTDFRDIVNNASSPALSFEELLADLRAQISDSVFAAGMRFDRVTDGGAEVALPLVDAHTLRSVIREAVQNVLKHAQVKSIGSSIQQQEGEIIVTVGYDGNSDLQDAHYCAVEGPPSIGRASWSITSVASGPRR
ncbi:sensor histidine kinase [Pararhodobacter sp. CCB-MM2]|uniref:sensor histidine kinase n=1 Tax=Pararhodobacter sp. CCB-MM2 TaxID=1786003 RepID=UPI000831C46D|nr:hypothetical protein [Pararhodobacter sp. CCB-MM2]